MHKIDEQHKHDNRTIEFHVSFNFNFISTFGCSTYIDWCHSSDFFHTQKKNQTSITTHQIPNEYSNCENSNIQNKNIYE